ncbi:MAG TPA: serine/threonine-protein kinase [Sandaracinaceae bacterium LLY-WYZ-13_1]|nr:serine/threonine-protein kinase [Sandaracinaceae bacterium LLY-WYZ-13_1]
MGDQLGSETYLLQRGGQILAGRYRVTELLGVGAMGSVWLAEQMALKTIVVVKFHEEGFVGSKAEVALERFLREARTIASVRHRNVCELYEVGRTEEGEPYLIMERLDGGSLAARLRDEGRLPVGESLAIAIALCHGLEAVHAAGVLHRDIKPENVFLHEDRELGVVPKLIDFGLARPAGDEKRITSNGKAVGTPGYMAPEQARGQRDLDARADLYAVGVTLYEMLSGELPARGETSMDLMVWTATEDPIPLAEHRPDLAGPVTDAVMKALAFPRPGRYEDARSMRLALEAVYEAHRSGAIGAVRATGRGAREPAPTMPEPDDG